VKYCYDYWTIIFLDMFLGTGWTYCTVPDGFTCAPELESTNKRSSKSCWIRWPAGKVKVFLRIIYVFISCIINNVCDLLAGSLYAKWVGSQMGRFWPKLHLCTCNTQRTFESCILWLVLPWWQKPGDDVCQYWFWLRSCMDCVSDEGIFFHQILAR
jgi:hypothetical protein